MDLVQPVLPPVRDSVQRVVGQGGGCVASFHSSVFLLLQLTEIHVVAPAFLNYAPERPVPRIHKATDTHRKPRETTSTLAAIPAIHRLNVRLLDHGLVEGV